MTTYQSSSIKGTLVACTIVAASALAALYQVTLGFRVTATEDGRRLQLLDSPVDLPGSKLFMPSPVNLRSDLRSDGRVAVISFFYSQCISICSVLGTQNQQLQGEILARGLEKKVRLISISFDPRDTPAILKNYSMRQHSKPEIWRFASVPAGRDRDNLLESFGIVVLPVPPSDYQHNAAFHIVDSHGRLRRIFDLAEQEAALDFAARLARDSQNEK